MSASPLLLTIADWQAAYRTGASPADLLLPLRRRLAERTDDVAILRLVSPAELDAQLAHLARAVATHPDMDALRTAMPLYGVPFVVKDNIDIGGVETTAACPAFAHVAEQSANVVRRLAGGRCRLVRQDQPRPVRDGPRRHALAVRRTGLVLRRRPHQRRLQLRLGRRRRTGRRAVLARHRHRRLPAASRPASTSWSG